jgi:hypothetical protein
LPPSRHEERTVTETEEKSLMEHHGITAMQQAVYHYRGFRYGTLMDALSYAELVTSREFAARPARTNEPMIE